MGRLSRSVAARPTTTLVALAAVVYLLVGLGLGARFGNESSDVERFYEPVARNLVDGAGFTDAQGDPAVRYPPGFPVLLAVPVVVAEATGTSLDLLLVLFTAATMAASCGVVHRIGRRLLGEPAASLGALLWALWPLNLWLAKQPNSEVPFALLVLLAVLAVARAAEVPASDRRGGAPDAALAGLALAGAALVRPAGLVLVVPVATWLWWQRRGRQRARPVGALLVVLVLAVAPWVAWASAATGHVVPLSDGGRDTIVDGLEVGIGAKSTEGDRRLAMPGELRSLLEDLSNAHAEGELETTGDVVRAVAREVSERPLAVAQLVGFKALRSWYGTESLRYETPIAALQLGTAALVAVGGVRAWQAGGRRRQALGLVLGVLGTSWLLTMAVISLVRYLTPALGLALLLGGVALEPVARRLARRVRAGPAEGRFPPAHTIAAMPTTAGADPVVTGGD